jgi:hypothetical protein
MKKLRLKSALERLETQLQSGLKPNKIDGKIYIGNVPLLPSDKERIEREISAIKVHILKVK